MYTNFCFYFSYRYIYIYIVYFKINDKICNNNKNNNNNNKLKKIKKFLIDSKMNIKLYNRRMNN
jgi:hypothetical protein